MPSRADQTDRSVYVEEDPTSCLWDRLVFTDLLARWLAKGLPSPREGLVLRESPDKRMRAQPSVRARQTD